MHVPYPGLPKRESVPSAPLPHRQSPALPTVIEHFRADPGPSADPYDRLYRARTIFLATPLDDATANDVITRLLDLDSNGDGEITLRINSAGGSFSSVLAVHDAIAHVAAPVHTVCLGQADGPAAVLLAVGEPGHRFMLPTAHVMLRQPTIDPPGRQGPDIESELERANWTRDTIEGLMADRIGRSREQIRHDLERPKLLTAHQAVEYGVADSVLTARH
jgi:ATP-dependent Clp protease protease subunit